MSFGSILLRLLMCLALALNGVPGAAAAAHAAHGSETHAEKTAAPAKASTKDMAGMPCHDTDAGRGEQDSTDEGDIGTAAADPDCCKGGCQCACVHTVASMFHPLSVAPAAFHASVAISRDTGTYVPPVLPHMIRPPIG